MEEGDTKTGRGERVLGQKVVSRANRSRDVFAQNNTEVKADPVGRHSRSRSGRRRSRKKTVDIVRYRTISTSRLNSTRDESPPPEESFQRERRCCAACVHAGCECNQTSDFCAICFGGIFRSCTRCEVHRAAGSVSPSASETVIGRFSGFPFPVFSHTSTRSDRKEHGMDLYQAQDRHEPQCSVHSVGGSGCGSVPSFWTSGASIKESIDSPPERTGNFLDLLRRFRRGSWKLLFANDDDVGDYDRIWASSSRGIESRASGLTGSQWSFLSPAFCGCSVARREERESGRIRMVVDVFARRCTHSTAVAALDLEGTNRVAN